METPLEPTSPPSGTPPAGPPPPPDEPVIGQIAVTVAPPQAGPASDLASPSPKEPSPAINFSQGASVPEAETVVVSSTPSKNPFVPASAASPNSNQTTGSVPPAGSPWKRRILMIAVFVIFLVATAFGGRFFLGLFAGSREVTLNYWGLWENDATVRSMITDFQTSHPKIKIQYTKQSPKQYRERLQAAIERGEGPDVFRFHNTWVPMIVRDLLPVPKTVMTSTEFSTTFYPVASGDLVAGSSIYGMPLMIDGLGLYYNEDLFAASGANVPITWNDVLELVPKLTVKSDAGIVTSAIALGTTGNVEHFSDILAVMILQNGAKLTNLKSKEAEETLIFYHKFADPSDPVYTWNESLDNSIAAFANGRVAMILAPSWRAFDIKQINPNLRFKIAPIPQLPGNTVTWASYWVEGVSAKTKYPEQAWEFIKYLTSKETATKLYSEISKSRLFGEPYARTDLASSLQADPFVSAYIKQATTAKSFPLASRTFDNGLNDKLIKYLEDAVNSLATGNSPAAALTTAQAGFTQVLSTYGLSSASAQP